MSVYRLLLSDRTLIRAAVNSVSYLTVMPVQRERGGEGREDERERKQLRKLENCAGGNIIRRQKGMRGREGKYTGIEGQRGVKVRP